jgi:hypothetical protein
VSASGETPGTAGGDPAVVTCPDCEYEVPALPYCVRCGEYLSDDLQKRKKGFAASPNESKWAPKIVSTIFPQLPRNEMDAFQIALALGTLTIVVLCVVKLFPLALIGAAVLVPILTILYLWEVDLYEDAPVTALGLSVVWGAGAGVLMGLIARHVVDPNVSVIAEQTTHTVVWRGVLLPVISVVLMLAGPLILLPYRKFNDVLDGATFGGACAVTFGGAELLVHSSTFLSGGLRPVGDVLEWTLRVLSLGIEIPVLAAAVIGSAAGSLWLRYRAPMKDRNALGVLGNPVIAVALAFAAMIGSALVQLYTRTWWEVAILAVMDILALLWLRQVLDLGLRQESAEIEIGPPVTCSNCGKQTPRHTFCAECGVSLQALPKSNRPDRPAAMATAPPPEPAA